MKFTYNRMSSDMNFIIGFIESAQEKEMGGHVGSVGESICSQTWGLEFDPWNPHSRRREPA